MKMSEMGAALKAHRKRQGLTLSEAAEELGTSVATISRIENGLQTPRRDLLEQMAEAYGLKDTLSLLAPPEMVEELHPYDVLSSKEEEILDCYRHMNARGKKTLHQLASDMRASEHYVEEEFEGEI